MDLEALMRTLGGRYDGCVADQRVVDTRVRDQVGLELVQIDVQRTIESQRRGDRADNLSYQAVEMLIIGTGNVKIASADIVHSFVVNQERAVGVLDSTVSR